ncbi:MAG: FoF1 ATP synthase subunit A [Mycoplasmoidaceae bacterium]
MSRAINWINLWTPNLLRLLGVVAVFLIILGSVLYYNSSIKRTKHNEAPRGFAFLIFNLINYFRNLTRDILGQDLEKLAPIFLTFFSYISLSNMIGMVGLENPTSSVAVCVTLGLCSFVGTFVMGFRYQRFSFLYKFTFNVNIQRKSDNKKIKIPVMVNPIEVIGSVTPLISLSFRLWGNIFAGVLIVSLIYNLPYALIVGDLSQLFPEELPGGIMTPDRWSLGAITLISSLFVPPLHAFLDIGIGLIQALVFILLTMVYWVLNKEHE